MSDKEINENSESNQVKNKEFKIPKIELTTTSFDNYTLNKEGTIKKQSDITQLENLFIDPKLESTNKEDFNHLRTKRNSILRIPEKSNNVTKSLDYLSINTHTNHLQNHATSPLKSSNDNHLTPLKNGFSKSQPNMLREEEETVNLQKHISKMFNHAFTDAIYSPRDSWLASVFNIYHAIILYVSVFLECYSTQLMVQETKSERTAWRVVSLIFTIQLCIYFIAAVILYPIRKRRHLAIIEAATSTKNQNENGETITYKNVNVTKNPIELYKGFIDFPHIMEFLGCLPFFVEEIFPKCRLINVNHYGLISFLLLCCRLYTSLSIFYYLRNRISKFFHIIIRATKESLYEIISVIVIYFIVMIFCSRIIFYADLSKCTLDEASQNWKRQNEDGTVNMEESCELQSNLDAFWYTFMTMTTLGFGDQVVNTYFGKIMATLAFGATPILYTLPSIVITTKMITLIIHDTKSAATKDVAKKHKRKFFNMTQFLSGNNNRKNKLSKLKKGKNNNDDDMKIANIDNENESKLKSKNKKKDNYSEKIHIHNKNNGKEKQGRYIVPLHDKSSGNDREDIKKSTLTVPHVKKEEASIASSIAPLINGNPITSFDTKDSKDFSFSNSNPSSESHPNSNIDENETPKENIKEDIEASLTEESDQPNMCESPKTIEEEPSLVHKSSKEFGPSELNQSIINQKGDLFSSANLTSSMTIKKFYQDNPLSVGKPLASIFENPESDRINNDEDKDIHPPVSSSATASNSNINNSNLSVTKSKGKGIFKSLPALNSTGSGSNSETENESTIFDYNAYKKNANNKNYIVGMLKQHYQTCLDEIDYVRKREKTLNSLKSGFEKGIMALQTM
ncbi:hypothetical protein BCR36DRAFT_404790 [Piromyces finnis]|uniref:Potassium channel domain-containing protein n=1 Tax=Piromyces finnis TaxID=1754191 RepID=A0A1Y1V7P0_9FUNG|nr:hypothetical protein BCR36DRAFT_404790 [Piromyces finnis]|eukprot:ORX49305.1 hypothetical protein BCR36DRAFT_404790 [Piromyces finnis]